MAEIVKGIQQITQKVVSWFIDIPEIPDTPEVEEIRGTLLNKSSNNAQIPVVYGERLLGGTRVFLQTSGTDNTYLYGALVLCEGEINAITQFQINDSAVTFSGSFAHGTEITSNDSKYGTTIKIQPFLGKDDQIASSTLSVLSNWGSNHKLSGVCYIAFRIQWDADKYTGIPNIKVKVQGKKISTFDNSSNETTNQYSTNPAFVLLDFLRNERYGKGIALTELDIPSFYTASTIADSTVTYFTGTTGKLFECHAVLNTNKKIIDNIKSLLRGMRGLMPYVQGVYKLIIETTGSAAISLNEDNIIGGIVLESERKDQKYNRVLVNFVNPDKNYQADTIVYDTGHSTFKTEDGGFLQEGNITLDTIISPYQAHEFGKIILERSRNNLKLGLTTNYETLDLAIGDIVNVSSTILGMTNKAFRVGGMTLNANFTASLSLQEHQESWYSFSTIDEVATISDTNFPDPFTVQPPSSITLTDELVEYSEGVVLTRLNIAVGASPDQFVSQYQVEVKLSTESDFKILAVGSTLNYEMLNVIDGSTYNVRVKAINSIGVNSSYASADRLIIGATLPPSDVKNFSVNMLGNSQMQLNWDANTDLDVSFYEIRYQNVSSNAQWNKSVNWLQVPRTSGTSITTNTRSGAFCIKAVDKLGNESNNETIIFSNIAQITENFKDIQTLTEDITAGTFDSDVALTDSSGTNSIVLDTKNDFDDLTGNFDSASGNFDLGGADDNIDDEGFYTLNQSLSLSAIYDVSFIKSITIDQIEDPYDQFDNGRGVALFDDAPAPFDGNDPTNATAQLQIASSTTSLDDATEFQPMNTSTTFKGRYFKFKLRLANKNNKTRAFVSGISIDVKMQKRTETGEDQASGTTTKTITFTNPFFALPSIGIAAQNMATGDFYSISNKSISGFDIVFQNSSGTNINRTFDFVAIGHGLKSSS